MINECRHPVGRTSQVTAEPRRWAASRDRRRQQKVWSTWTKFAQPSSTLTHFVDSRVENQRIVMERIARTYTCPYFDAGGNRCLTTLRSRSGMWRHCIAVHGSRYYVSGRLETLREGELEAVQRRVRMQQ